MQKFDGLTSLRALAALWVAVLHFRMGDLADQTAAPFLVKAGYHGVTIFFVLSGFILGYTYKNFWLAKGPIAPKARRYWTARFARIYPTHLFMLVVFAAVLVPAGIWGSPPYNDAKSFVMNVLLIQSWGFFTVVTWNEPAWTVSVELICYIVFPALVWICAPLRGRGTHVAFGIAAAASVLLLLTLQTEPPKFVFAILNARMCGWFVLGYLLYLSFDASKPVLSSLQTIALLAAGLALIVVSAWVGYRLDGLPAVGVCAVIYALAAGSGPARRLFELAPLVYLGEVSYSFFLSHEATWAIIGRFSPHFGKSVATIPLWIELLFCLLIAMAIYHCVEAPARRWIRDRAESRALSRQLATT